jgi:hypothetical protein
MIKNSGGIFKYMYLLPSGGQNVHQTFSIVARDSDTVVEHPPHHLKVLGSSLAVVTVAWEKCYKTFYCCNLQIFAIS